MKTFEFKINTNEDNVSTMYAYRAHYFDKEDKEYYGKIFLSEDKALNEIDINIRLLKLYNHAFIDKLLIFV